MNHQIIPGIETGTGLIEACFELPPVTPLPIS